MNYPRFAAAALVAFVVAFTLFRLMAALIAMGERPPVVVAAPASLERVRIVAEPPPPPPPPVSERREPQALTPARPELPLAIERSTLAAAPIALPEIALDLAITGRPQSTGTPLGVAGGTALAAFARGAAGFTGAELVPLASARPRYPRSAAARGIEGWVELIFVVTGDGRVENVRVLDASPRGVFEDAAVHAMRNWVYAPFHVNGRAVAREGTQLIRFRLDDINELHLWDD